MRLQTALSILVIVGLLVPAAGAGATTVSDPLDTASPTETTVGTESGNDSSSESAENYTRLYIEDRYTHLRLKPGQNDTTTVTVVNTDEEAVTISPHLVRPDPRSLPLDDEWVTITAPDTELAPDESVEVTVSVAIPETADLGEYRTELAFTDETITYPGRPARPVHSTTLNVDVWKEPTVRILSGHRLYTQVEAGGEYVHQIVIENTGDEAVALAPEFESERRHRSRSSDTVDRSWFEIDAPNEIQPGETAIVNVTIAPGADVDRGRYSAELDLGLKDPARPERDSYWQQIDLDFQVWQQPEEPFENTFEVSEAATSITLTIAPRPARGHGDSEPVGFDVTLVSPDGTTVTPERVQVTDRGFVDLTEDRRPGAEQREGDYGVRDGSQEFVYRVDAPAAGTWTLRIMPENTFGFRYEIVREEAAD